MILGAAETVLGFFGFNRAAYGNLKRNNGKRRWYEELREQSARDIKTEMSEFFYRATTKIGQHKNARFGIATGSADSGSVGLPVVVAYIRYYTMISSILFQFSASFLYLFSSISTECQKLHFFTIIYNRMSRVFRNVNNVASLSLASSFPILIFPVPFII